MSPVNAKRVVLSTVITLGALMLAACGGNTSSTASSSTASSPSAAAAAATDLAGTAWNLTAFADAKGAEVPGTTGANVGTLAFAADGTFSGSTGCNRLVGSYKQDGSALTMAPGPMTKMACPPDVTAQEDAILAALPKVASFTSGTALVLTNAAGGTLLTYAPGTASLAGTSWTATGINNGKDAVVAQAGTEKVTISFGTDGTVRQHHVRSAGPDDEGLRGRDHADRAGVHRGSRCVHGLHDRRRDPDAARRHRCHAGHVRPVEVAKRPGGTRRAGQQHADRSSCCVAAWVVLGAATPT
jgi:heat shock protein HslJ